MRLEYGVVSTVSENRNYSDIDHQCESVPAYLLAHNFGNGYHSMNCAGYLIRAKT